MIIGAQQLHKPKVLQIQTKLRRFRLIKFGFRKYLNLELQELHVLDSLFQHRADVNLRSLIGISFSLISFGKKVTFTYI